MHMLLLSPRTSPQLASLHFTSKQSHFTSITPVHSTSLHFTSLHVFTLNPHLNSLACNYILNPLFSLQGRDASKPAGNWFQLLMVLFTKEYLPTYVLCFLVLIFGLCYVARGYFWIEKTSLTLALWQRRDRTMEHFRQHITSEVHPIIYHECPQGE
jgi:hypothetical protein